MEIQRAASSAVVVDFDPSRRASQVSPLSGEEITALRQLLARAAAIISTCPIAKRVVEEQGL